MKTRLFGPTGIAVPIIGQGTWEMEDDDRDACVAALRAGIDAGMTHIDTAEMYGDGYVEEAIVAEAIAGRRDELFLASKVLPENASFAGTIAACERSLRRLRTDRLDLYYLHWRGRHPIEETFGAFERLRQDGKIRAYAVSNFDAAALEEALAASAGFAADQVLYHLEERAAERLVLPACEAAGLAMVAYSPFGHGQLPWLHGRSGRVLVDIARAHDTTPGAVVLAFVTRRARVFAIPKAAHPDHALANAAGGELRLSTEELARIDAAFAPGPPPRELPML
jgi:diketogulonate reductase-like aldo/keto reductase